MAKRPKRPPKPTRNLTDGVIVDDYGIYHEASLDANDKALLEKNIRRLRAASRPSHSLSALEKLHGLRQQMRTLIALAVIPEGAELEGRRWATIAADLGDGPQKLLCYADREAGIDEAAAVLTAIDILMIDNPDEKEAAIFLSGLNAGRMVERMHVLPVEPLVKHEKNRRDAKRENMLSKREKVREMYVRLRGDDPYGKKSTLVNRILAEAKFRPISKRTADGFLTGLK